MKLTKGERVLSRAQMDYLNARIRERKSSKIRDACKEIAEPQEIAVARKLVQEWDDAEDARNAKAREAIYDEAKVLQNRLLFMTAEEALAAVKAYDGKDV